MHSIIERSGAHLEWIIHYSGFSAMELPQGTMPLGDSFLVSTSINSHYFEDIPLGDLPPGNTCSVSRTINLARGLVFLHSIWKQVHWVQSCSKTRKCKCNHQWLFWPPWLNHRARLSEPIELARSSSKVSQISFQALPYPKSGKIE